MMWRRRRAPPPPPPALPFLPAPAPPQAPPAARATVLKPAAALHGMLVRIPSGFSPKASMASSVSESASASGSASRSSSPLSVTSSLALSLRRASHAGSAALAAGAAREAALRLRLDAARSALAQERRRGDAAIEVVRDLRTRLAAAISRVPPPAAAAPPMGCSSGARPPALLSALLAQREAELCAARRERDAALARLEAAPRLSYVGFAAALLDGAPHVRRWPSARPAAAAAAAYAQASNPFKSFDD